MPKETRMFFISLSQVFKKICSKVIDPNIIEVLKAKTAETMSTTEKVCPLACFDIMTHLVVRLVKELELCGLVHTRWMYPMERYIKTLKGYVRNMA
jgi:hypothetical protein